MASFDPLVSIVIPVYNRAAFIFETLRSVQNQTYQNWEAIVIDDGSTDITLHNIQLISENEPRIKYYSRNRLPRGASTCRNIGIDNANGEFLLFLDSDDLLADFCLQRRVAKFAKYPDKDFLVFQSKLFDQDIHDKNIVWNIDTAENDLQRFLRIDALWPICGPLYKKSVIMEASGFREGLPFYQDFDLHLRLLLLKAKYEKFLTEEPDVYIRDHANNSVSNSISFTSDTRILQQRIDFFFYQMEFINARNIHLSRSQKETVWNILFYFCGRFLLEHNDRKSYRENWAKTGKLLSVNPLKQKLAYMVPVLTSLQKKSTYFIKTKSLYILWFKKYLADESVIFNSTLKNIKLQLNER